MKLSINYFFFFFFLILLFFSTPIHSREFFDNSELCDGCFQNPHCELKKPFYAIVCDDLKTKQTCQSVNGCIWVE